MFSSYENLEEWLTHRTRKADLKSIHSYLAECIEKETNSLVENSLRGGRAQRRSKRIIEECARDAQEHYCEEINEALESNQPLHHWEVISYRRKPHAWAIARGIADHLERVNATVPDNEE